MQDIVKDAKVREIFDIQVREPDTKKVLKTLAMDIPSELATLVNTQHDEVLIVEDNEDNAFALKSILQALDITSSVAADAQEADAFLSEKTPKLILMDIGLPGKNGLEITAQLRENIEYTDIPIVAITAHGSKIMKEKALKAGCNGFIVKPFLSKEIIGTISEYL